MNTLVGVVSGLGIPTALAVVAPLIVLGLAAAQLVRSVQRSPGIRRAAGLGGPPAAPELPLPVRLVDAVDNAALGLSATAFVIVWTAAVGVAVAVGAVVGVFGVGLLLVAVAVLMPACGLWLLRHRRDRQIEADLPAALESIGRSVRSGASFPQAVAESVRVLRGPLRNEVATLDRRLELGQPLTLVLREWSHRRPLPGVRLTAAALAFSFEAGGVRSRAIDGLAASLRDRSALEREVAALASQARMSGVVISILPIGFVFVSSTLDPQVAGFLFGTPGGLLCLLGGLALDAIGFGWMHRLTASIK